MATQPSNGDLINMLPVDNSVPTDEEIQTINSIFKKEKTTVNKIFGELKWSFFIAVLFVVISLPIVDTTIKRFIPITERNWMILIAVKAVVFTAIFYLMNNIHLIKTS